MIPDKKMLREKFVCGTTAQFDTIEEHDLVFAKPRVPYAILDSAIRDFRDACYLQKRLVREGKRKRFEMKPRSTKQHASFKIHHVNGIKRISLASNTQTKYMIFDYSLGVVTINEYIPFSVDHDCRMSWNGLDVYKLHIPRKYNPTQTLHIPKGVCAIDPGERTFATVYGSDGVLRSMGDGFSKKIDKWACIAQRMREGIARTVDVNGNKVFSKAKNHRTKKHLKKVARRMEIRTTNRVTDFHRAVIKTITNTYETIIIPVFNTSQMVKRYNENGKWKRVLGKDTVRRLIRLSHYKFRERLISKAGKRVVVGTEEWTSKRCGNCFNIHYDLGASKVFECPHCGVVMGRDDNAARNIMLLNWERATLQMHVGCSLPSDLLSPNWGSVLV
jgi:transposase